MSSKYKRPKYEVKYNLMKDKTPIWKGFDDIKDAKAYAKKLQTEYGYNPVLHVN
jgi:hypothetical protein